MDESTAVLTDTPKFRIFCPECTEEINPAFECYLVQVSGEKLRICQTCFGLYITLSDHADAKVKEHFAKAHTEWVIEEKKKKRLRPGSSYFG